MTNELTPAQAAEVERVARDIATRACEIFMANPCGCIPYDAITCRKVRSAIREAVKPDLQALRDELAAMTVRAERAEANKKAYREVAEEWWRAHGSQVVRAETAERERDEAALMGREFLARIKTLEWLRDHFPNGLWSQRKKAAEFDTLGDATRALLASVKAWGEEANDQGGGMPDDVLSAYKAAKKALGPVGDAPETTMPPDTVCNNCDRTGGDLKYSCPACGPALGGWFIWRADKEAMTPAEAGEKH